MVGCKKLIKSNDCLIWLGGGSRLRRGSSRGLTIEWIEITCKRVRANRRIIIRGKSRTEEA